MRLGHNIFIIFILLSSVDIINAYNNILLSVQYDNKLKLKAPNINKLNEKKYNSFEEYFYNNENNMKILKIYYDYYDKHKTKENIELDIYNYCNCKYNNNIELKYDIDFNKDLLDKMYNNEYVKDIHLSKNDNTVLITFHNSSKHEYIYKNILF